MDEVDVESHDPQQLRRDVDVMQLEAKTTTDHVMDDDEEEGALMIDDSRPSKKSKGNKNVSSSLYFSEKRNKSSSMQRGGSSDGKHGGKKATRKDKGKPRFTAYMLWAKANRDRVVQETPIPNAGDFSTISKHLGQVWSSVPMSEKYQVSYLLK